MITGSSVRPYAVGPGTRLAGRYRLERLLVTMGEAALWRAVDETLARRVAVHTLPLDSPPAHDVVAAARAASRLGDPRFLRILDAAAEETGVYTVQEWVQAHNLPELLADGPLPPHEAAQLAADVAAALAAAHQAGLTHGCLRPTDVLRTDSGQTKVVGLGVAAALRDGPRGLAAMDADTPAAASVLYAGLTGRWPGGSVDGLPGAPRDESGRLASPRQVRAGVPHPLDEIAYAGLGGRPGLDALRSPGEIAEALRPLVRGGRPEPLPPLPRVSGGPVTDPLPPPPPPAPSARAARVAVAGVVAVALGLLAWQMGVEVLGDRTGSEAGQAVAAPSASPSATPVGDLRVAKASDFDPEGNGEESPRTVALAVDDDPSTAWRTVSYKRRADLGGLKSGVGLVLDLGRPQRVREVRVALVGEGTDLELRAAPAGARSAPTDTQGFGVVASVEGAGRTATLAPDEPVNTRYLLLWLTRLPAAGGDYRGGVADVTVRG